MLVDPLNHATFHFKQLFSSFRLRGLFQASEESIYLEEYLSFIDKLRRTRPNVQQTRLLDGDAVDFISRQHFWTSSPHLSRMFRLSCLCLDEPRCSSPVRFGSVKTDHLTCATFDLVTPIQSCFDAVARGLDNLTSDESIARLLKLEMTLASFGLSDTYSPWDEVNYFGRDQIRSAIDSRSPERRKVVTIAPDDQACSSKSVKRSSPKKSVNF